MIYLAIASAFLVWAASDWWRDVQHQRQCDRVEREYYQREHDALARIAEAERMARQVADDIHDRDWDGEWSVDAAIDSDPLHRVRWSTVEELLGHTVTEEGD